MSRETNEKKRTSLFLWCALYFYVTLGISLIFSCIAESVMPQKDGFFIFLCSFALCLLILCWIIAIEIFLHNRKQHDKPRKRVIVIEYKGFEEVKDPATLKVGDVLFVSGHTGFIIVAKLSLLGHEYYDVVYPRNTLREVILDYYSEYVNSITYHRWSHESGTYKVGHVPARREE